MTYKAAPQLDYLEGGLGERKKLADAAQPGSAWVLSSQNTQDLQMGGVKLNCPDQIIRNLKRMI
jgi:hypothetical protein